MGRIGMVSARAAWVSGVHHSLFPILACCLAFTLAAGCFEYTEDSQENLKSMGAPGVPVWKADSSKSAQGGSAGVAAAQLDADDSGAPPAWLSELNHLRALGGLGPVSENVTLDQGCAQHARYLVAPGPIEQLAFEQYASALGPKMHHEDPSSPFYTAGGAECAQGGKRESGMDQAGEVTFNTDPAADIDELFYAPFHRILLMTPSMTIAGYGSYGSFPRRAAALALRGPYDPNPPVVRFPAEGTVLTSGAYSYPEFPDPLQACPGYQYPVGMPITLQFGYHHTVRLVSSSMSGPNGPVENCIFDAASYTNPQPSVQEYGRNILAATGGVIMIPRTPLNDGTYSVAIATKGNTLTWTFTVRNSAHTADGSVSRH